MAGYFGTRAVLLSTTAAVVTGDMTVAGATTVDVLTATGAVAIGDGLTVDGIISTTNGLDIDMDASASGQLKLDGAGYGGAIALNTQGMNIYTNSATRDVIFGTNETERMRIDSSGNVGIGTASPSSLMHVHGVSPFVTIKDSRNKTWVPAESLGGINFDSADVSNSITTQAKIEVVTDNTSSGTYAAMAFSTSTPSALTEAMRIDSSGNVGIGTTSPAVKLHVKNAETTTGAVLRVQGAAAVAANGRLGDIDFWGGRYSSNTGKTLGQIRVGNQLGAYWDGSPSREVTYMSFSTANNQTLSEAMRIDSSGNVLVNATSGSSTDTMTIARKSGSAIKTTTGTSGNVNHIIFQNSNGAVGSIRTNGSATSYSVSSDYRLKENVTPIQGAADIVKAMRPCTYNFKADANDWHDGFLAHELQEVHPRAVSGDKDAMRDEEYEVTPAVYEDVVTPAVDAVAATYDDEGLELTPAVEAAPETTENTLVTEAVTGTRSVPDMQGVDYAKLTPILTAALQEALTEIAALKVRVAALEVTP